MSTTFIDTFNERLNEQLDRIEATLPTFPARVFHLQRSLANAAYERTQTVVNAFSDTTKNLFDVTRLSGRTVTGQARAAAGQVATSARTGARTVAGQATAQGRKVADTARSESEKLVNDAIDAVESDVDTAQSAVEATQPSSGRGRRYETWTKAELLDRAKELDLEGRSTMSKRELIKALRAA